MINQMYCQIIAIFIAQNTRAAMLIVEKENKNYDWAKFSINIVDQFMNIF